MYDLKSRRSSTEAKQHAIAQPAPGKRTLTDQLPPAQGTAHASTSGGATAQAPAALTAGPDMPAPGAEPFDDGGRYKWILRNDQAFECVQAPPPRTEKRHTTIDKATSPDAWQFLWGKWQEHLAAKQKPAPPAQSPEAPAQSPEAPAQSPEIPATTPVDPAPPTGSSGGVFDAIPSLNDVVEGITEVVAPVGELLGELTGMDPVEAFDDWWNAEPAAPPATEAPVAEEPAQQPAPPSGDGAAIDENLEQAKRIADGTALPHTYKVVKQVGDPLAADRRDALLAGDTEKLKTIVCSEFTVLSLQASRVDLTQRYRDQTTDLPVAYTDKNGLTFVDLYMVTNNQPEAWAATIEAQHGNAEQIDPGTDRAKEIGSSEPGAFLHFDKFEMKFVAGENRIVVRPEQGDAFGAGATAIALGGKPVKPGDRRPGDLQQRWDTNEGVTAGAGHSSTVWAVRGSGIAKLGVTGSPTLCPAPSFEIPPGWYRVDGAAGVFLEAGPETDPATLASLDVDYVQLIEANSTAGDATGIGDEMKAEDSAFDPAKASSRLTSTGRLPTSKWKGPPAKAEALAGAITKDGIVPSA